jgi:hypothetical protein
MFRGNSDGNARIRAEVRLGDVTDGLSNTLLASEHLVGDNNNALLMNGKTSEPRIGTAFAGAVQFPTQAEIDTFGAACLAITAHNFPTANPDGFEYHCTTELAIPFMPNKRQRICIRS